MLYQFTIYRKDIGYTYPTLDTELYDLDLYCDMLKDDENVSWFRYIEIGY